MKPVLISGGVPDPSFTGLLLGRLSRDGSDPGR